MGALAKNIYLKLAPNKSINVVGFIFEGTVSQLR